MFNALQGVDALVDGFHTGISRLGDSLYEQRLQRSHAATVDGYNALTGRYNELLAVSTSVTERLKKALEAERAENARLRAMLARFK